jgi:hypothetical protein
MTTVAGRHLALVCIPVVAMTILLLGSTADVCTGQEPSPQPLMRRKRVVPILAIDMEDAADGRHRNTGLMMDGVFRILRNWRDEVESSIHRPMRRNSNTVVIDDHEDSDRGSSQVAEAKLYGRFMEDSSLDFSFFSMEFSLHDMSMSVPSDPTPKPPPSTPTTAPAGSPPTPTIAPVSETPVPSPPPVAEPTDPPVTEPTESPETYPTHPPITEPTNPPETYPTDPPGTAPTDPVPLPPFAECSTLPRNEAMEKVLSLITEPSILNDPSTAQGMAYDWLLNSDPAEVDPCTFPTVQQRYGLVTLYYSTNGDGWTNSIGWLSGANECMWAGITCEVDVVNEILLSESPVHLVK